MKIFTDSLLNEIIEKRSSNVKEGVSLIIYDDFYKDPDEIREYALNLNYEAEGRGSYPGINSRSRHLDEKTIKKFEGIIGKPIIVDEKDAFGVFRISKLNSNFKSFIHTDPTEWGGVIYLNPAENSLGGTAFWRSKEHGFEEFPWNNYKDYGFDSVEAAWKKIVSEDGNEEAKWDLVQMVPARYNRLILFNTRLMHSHMPRQNFGLNNFDARLVQVFFFRTSAS